MSYFIFSKLYLVGWYRKDKCMSSKHDIIKEKSVAEENKSCFLISPKNKGGTLFGAEKTMGFFSRTDKLKFYHGGEKKTSSNYLKNAIMLLVHMFQNMYEIKSSTESVTRINKLKEVYSIIFEKLDYNELFDGIDFFRNDLDNYEVLRTILTIENKLKNSGVIDNVYEWMSDQYFQNIDDPQYLYNFNLLYKGLLHKILFFSLVNASSIEVKGKILGVTTNKDGIALKNDGTVENIGKYINGNNLPLMDFESIVKKTFILIPDDKGIYSFPKTIEDIRDDILSGESKYLNSLITMIGGLDGIFDKLLKIKSEAKNIKIGKREFTIFYEKAEEKSNLDKISSLYEKTKNDYYNILKNEGNDKGIEFKNKILDTEKYNVFYNRSDVVGQDYFSVSMYSFYLMFESFDEYIYESFNGNFRVSTLRANGTILTNFKSLTLKEGGGGSYYDIVSEEDKSFISGLTPHNLFSNLEVISGIINSVDYLEEIRKSVEIDLAEIEEKVKSEKGNEIVSYDKYIGETLLDGLGDREGDKSFTKYFYNEKEKTIYERINEYWNKAKNVYTGLVKEGRIQESDMVKSFIVGEYSYQKDYDRENLKKLVGEDVLKLNTDTLYNSAKNKIFYKGDYEKGNYQYLVDTVGKPSDDIYFDRKIKIGNVSSKDWNLWIENKISFSAESLELLYDIREFNIVDLYSMFFFYEYDPSNSKIVYLTTSNNELYVNKHFFDYEKISDVRVKGLNKFDFREKLKERILEILKEIADTETGGKYVSSVKQLQLHELDYQALIDKESEIKDKIVEVEDFYYVDKKYTPIGKKIDIEFYISDNKFENPDYISVSKKTSEISPRENYGGLYEDNYFKSLELRDLGGEKEITLILSSGDENNLERIIYNSMIGPIGKFNKNISKDNTIDTAKIKDVIKSKDTHFRVRFGYSDMYEDSIESDSFFSNSFRNRTQKIGIGSERVLPVRTSPWMYFIIKDITAKTIDDEMVYEIEGITMSRDFLSNFSLYSKDANHIKLGDRGVLDGVALIGGKIFHASGGRMGILWENKNEVVTGYRSNTEEILTETLKMENEVSIFGGVETSLPKNWKLEDVKSAGFEKGDVTTSKDLVLERNKNKEGNLTIRDILDSLMKWLPKKYYIVVKSEEFGVYAEEYQEKHEELIRKDINASLVALTPTYEVIEAKAEPEGNEKPKDIVLIRISYKGPKEERYQHQVRKYSYKQRQNTVIKSFSIKNEVGLENVMEYSSIVGTGYDVLFSSLFLENGFNYPKKRVAEPVHIEDANNNTFMVPSKNYITYYSDVPIEPKEGERNEESKRKIERALSNIANDHMNKMEMWPFEGELEILGDPYFLFDDTIKMGEHLIFLEVNRLNKLAIEEEDYIDRSYYTGVYMVMGIEHRINSDGEFTTILNILKDEVR